MKIAIALLYTFLTALAYDAWGEALEDTEATHNTRWRRACAALVWPVPLVSGLMIMAFRAVVGE